MKRTSRYQNVSRFQPDPRGNSDFKGVRPRDIPNVEGRAEHVVKSRHRLEHLAQEYYQACRLWYRLGDANPTYTYSEDMVFDQGSEAPANEDPLGREDRIGRIIIIPGIGDDQ